MVHGSVCLVCAEIQEKYEKEGGETEEKRLGAAQPAKNWVRTGETLWYMNECICALKDDRARVSSAQCVCAVIVKI